MTKEEIYKQLVERRKACFFCREFGMKNQAEFPHYDTQEIGNLTTWSNNLRSKILIVGQDFYHQNGFLAQHGQVQFGEELSGTDDKKGYSTKTNYYLKTLIDHLPEEFRLSPPRNDGKNSNNPLFLTNAVLCLKSGNASSKIEEKCYSNCATKFLDPLINMLKPELKVIITLGKPAALSVLSIFEKKAANLVNLRTHSMNELLAKSYIKVSDSEPAIFMLYHPSRFHLNRSFVDHVNDWLKVKDYIINIST